MLESAGPLNIRNATFAAVSSLAEPMSDEIDSNGPRPISAEAFENRKRFARFGEDDAALLSQLREVFSENAESLVERFYAHLLNYDALQPLLADAATVERLKGFQREYLCSLASGDYGESYAARRQEIGRAHDNVGRAGRSPGE